MPTIVVRREGKSGVPDDFFSQCVKCQWLLRWRLFYNSMSFDQMSKTSIHFYQFFGAKMSMICFALQKNYININFLQSYLDLNKHITAKYTFSLARERIDLTTLSVSASNTPWQYWETTETLYFSYLKIWCKGVTIHLRLVPLPASASTGETTRSVQLCARLTTLALALVQTKLASGNTSPAATLALQRAKTGIQLALGNSSKAATCNARRVRWSGLGC